MNDSSIPQRLNEETKSRWIDPCMHGSHHDVQDCCCCCLLPFSFFRKKKKKCCIDGWMQWYSSDSQSRPSIPSIPSTHAWNGAMNEQRICSINQILRNFQSTHNAHHGCIFLSRPCLLITTSMRVMIISCHLCPHVCMSCFFFPSRFFFLFFILLSKTKKEKRKRATRDVFLAEEKSILFWRRANGWMDGWFVLFFH